MATGGIFQLITNDGRQDRMIMATALLNSRLAQVRAVKGAAGPTLADIEKTHIIFTHAHFKPFAAIGYEYNKVKASAGNPQLGSEIQFSIPQFGDFFHDMVLHVKLRQPELVIADTVAASDRPRMRWCPYPGERLVQKCQFEVNGNPLDEYTSHSYNFYREFQVPPHKRAGWDRCFGQETAHRGYLDQPDWAGSGVTPSASDARVKVAVCDGNQTPSGQKLQTDANDLEMFIPLLFWCNKDPRLSIPSVAIPYGQRFINVTLADQQDLVNVKPRGTGSFGTPLGTVSTATNLVRTCELYINNIFVNPEVHDIFIKRIGFNLIRVHRQQVHNADKSSDEVLLQQLKWPIESLFVGMKMKDYTSTAAAMRVQHLDKWHTFSQVTDLVVAEDGWGASQQKALTASSAATLEMKPTTQTAVLAGAAVEWTSSGSATTFIADGLLVGDTVVIGTNSYRLTITPATELVLQTTALADHTTADLVGPALLGVSGATFKTSTVAKCVRTLDSVTIKAHGIPIYNGFPAAFYNAYIPLHYGGPNIQTPDDCGALMITFNLYPGTYQPSGHINISRAREFYLEYTSSIIASGTEGRLVVIASAINFLLISDGSAVLRYST